MKMYKTEEWTTDIMEVKYFKKSEKSVWLSEGNRHVRHTNYVHYWDTWEEAFEYLKDKYTKKITAYERLLMSAKKSLDKVNNLKQ